MKYFEDLVLGEKIFYRNHYEVTEEEILEVGRRWDPQPFHTDPEAAKASIFGGLVASSVHLFAMWVAIGTKDEEGVIAAVSALGFTNFKLYAPVRPGDFLYTCEEIKGLRASKSRPDCGIVESYNEVLNQRDEVVFSIEHAFMAKFRNPTNTAK